MLFTISLSIVLYKELSLIYRYIYEYGLYCEGADTPGGAARYRRATPQFYRTNPAMIHRLAPWLNRELVAILPSSDNVSYVEGHILSEVCKHELIAAR